MLTPEKIVLLGLALAGGALLERAVDPYLTPPPTPVILKAEEYGRSIPASSFEAVYEIWMNLQKPAYMGTDDTSRSFVQVLEELGYQVEVPKTFGSAPRTDRAGREGLLVRPVPSTLPEFGVVGRVNWGHKVNWIAEFPVSTPDKSTDIFGLTQEGFVRLGTGNPDGTFDWYVEAADRK